MGFGGVANGIRNVRGKLSEIVNQICEEWDLEVVRIADTFYFWSRTWAFDRQMDISERRLRSYRNSFRKTGMFSDQENHRIAGEFSYPQVRVTFQAAFPERESWGLLEYHKIRVFSQLPPQEWNVLKTEKEIPVSALSYSVQNALLERELAMKGKDTNRVDFLNWLRQQSVVLELPPRTRKPILSLVE